MPEMTRLQLFRLRYSLATLAAGTKLEKSTISRILSGETEPLISSAAAIAAFTGMSLDDFYSLWRDEIRPQKPNKR